MNSDRVSIRQLIRRIEQLPSDRIRHDPRKWYKTQKEHWIGWLREYHGPGAYNRRVGARRDASFAYNHIVEAKMLLWLISAAGVGRSRAARARMAARKARSLSAKSAAIRREVPWSELAKALFER